MVQQAPLGEGPFLHEDDHASAFRLVSALQGVKVECGVAAPTGDGVRDPHFLLRGPA